MLRSLLGGLLCQIRAGRACRLLLIRDLAWSNHVEETSVITDVGMLVVEKVRPPFLSSADRT